MAKKAVKHTHDEVLHYDAPKVVSFDKGNGTVTLSKEQYDELVAAKKELDKQNQPVVND